MTYGYGPPPPEWQPSDEDPDASRRRRGPGPDAGPAPYARFGGQGAPPPDPYLPPPPPGGYPSVPQRPRIPSPPPPARFEEAPPAPPRRRPNNASGQPPAYPAFAPPVPTSPPTMPARGLPPRPGYQAGAPPQAPPRPAGPPPGPMGSPAARPLGPPTGPLSPAGRPAPRPGGPGGPGGPVPGRGGPPGRGGARPRAAAPAPPRSLPGGPAPAIMPRVRLKNAVPGLIRHLPHHKPWMVALSVIAIVVVIGTCGFGSYLLVRDDGTVVAVDPNATPTVPTRDISNRTADPTPLTVNDVFPNVEIVADPSVPPYKRFGDAQVATDCRVAASSDLGKTLVSLGCNQVVRATFSSTDGQFLVTAGIFNLPDVASATKAESEIKNLSDQSKGRLSGFVPQQAVQATKMLGRSPTHVAWDAHEHFVLYTVICRVDGKDFEAEDPHAKIIVYDIVEKYLRDHVVAQWAIDKAALGSASPSTSP